MRQVRVQLKDDVLRPGEVLEGEVVVTCDSPFECNRISLDFTGKELTEISIGEDRYSDTYTHVSDYVVLIEAPQLQEGITTIPFQYIVPKGVPPSFSGYNARIYYSVKAVIELDWRPDPSHTQMFQITPETPPYIPEPLEPRAITDRVSSMTVMLPSDVLRQGKGLDTRVCVDEKRGVDKVRVSLVERVRYSCGSHTGLSERTIPMASRDIDPSDFGRWLEFMIAEDRLDFVPMEAQLIQVDYLVKVELGAKWQPDPHIKIPIRVSGPEAGREDRKETELDFGFDF